MLEQKVNYKPLPIALFLGGILSIFAGISNYLHFNSLAGQLELSIQAQAKVIADNIAPALQFSDEVTADGMINSLRSNQDITSALVVNHAGALFAGWLTHQQQVYDHKQSPIAVRARLVDVRIKTPIYVGGHIKGALVVDYSLDQLRKKMLGSVLGSMSVIVVIMLIAFLLLSRLKQVQTSKQAIEQDHRQTQDSIRYASLIQNAFIPTSQDFERYFSEHFCIWRPKDIVGGDIYALAPLRHQDEMLLMVIDCTGHGVPGAFVSMLVKAIEQQIIANLLHQQDEINPAQILLHFNQSLKGLLNQAETAQEIGVMGQQSKQHAGFDGGILYYDRQRQLIKFAGANLSLFYMNQGEVSVIKGDRYSVGYQSCDAHYLFTEHQLYVTEETTLYLTTDGYADQNGGEKLLPFGKRRFTQVLASHQHLSLTDQAQMLMRILEEFQKNEPQTDDITVIGVKI